MNLVTGIMYPDIPGYQALVDLRGTGTCSSHDIHTGISLEQ